MPLRPAFEPAVPGEGVCDGAAYLLRCSACVSSEGMSGQELLAKLGVLAKGEHCEYPPRSPAETVEGTPADLAHGHARVADDDVGRRRAAANHSRRLGRRPAGKWTAL